MLKQWLKRPPFRLLRRSTRAQAAQIPIVIHGGTSSAEAYEAVFVASQSVPAHQFISHWLHEEGMERVSPVQLAFLRPLMSFADAKDQDPEPQLHKSFAVSSNANVFCTGTFPHSISGSKLPVCSLRGHASPALQTARWHTSSHEIDWLHQG